MKHYDQVLREYADNGMRSAAEWFSLGRQVNADAKPRAETTYKGALRGERLALYTRDQTSRRPPR
jgi:hypothetical protein